MLLVFTVCLQSCFVIVAVHQEGFTVEMCSQEYPATNVLLGKSVIMDMCFGYCANPSCSSMTCCCMQCRQEETRTGFVTNSHCMECRYVCLFVCLCVCQITIADFLIKHLYA